MSPLPAFLRYSALTCAAVLILGIPAEPSRAAVRNAEDLLIVDCLLPGQVRKLGRMASYMSARRPIRTNQADCEIRGGEYVAYDRANYQTALKVWMEQAMVGDAEAQNNVGEIYAKGLGTAPDYGMAFQWFKKAADQGNSRAKINLGYLYEQGLGVAQDTAAALNLYREASGIQDELLFASAVEVQMKAKDERITDLQGQVQTEQQRSQQLQQRVEQLQRELASKRQALQQSQNALRDTETKLANAKQAEDKELTRFLENQLLSQERQIAAQRSQIASLERRSASGGGVMAGGPSFEILEPLLVATRGKPAASVRVVGPRRVLGRVSTPGSIRQITVNGVAAPVEKNGTFAANVNVPAGGTSVEVVATAADGDRQRVAFSIIPQAGAAPTPQAIASVGKLPSGVKLGRYFAVVIGNNQYRDAANYPSLKSAANDASAVANLLKSRYGMQTTLVLNGSRLEMLSAISAMREVMKPEDNLLVYYAGHGEFQGREGYWVPSDGVGSNPKTWISNAAISDILNTLPARKVMVVADSCYSGSMTRTASAAFDAQNSPEKWNQWVSAMAQGRSRLALTSGGVQPVPDGGAGNHSYFARAFLNALKNNSKLMEGQRLYREVTNNLAITTLDSAIEQVPEYAPIRFAGHQSGEFFFLPKI